MPEKPATTSRDRRTYAVTVLAGLTGAALTAVGGAREWASTHASAAGIKVEGSVTGAESQPLVASLGLVALTAWGVVLVSRGRARRLVAVVGLLASAGALAGVVLGFSAVKDDSVTAAVAKGATGESFSTALSAWYYLAGLGALLTMGAFVVAVARAPRWPAMGSRYDAPSARPGAATEEDMWRALDEGRDPTS